MHLMVTIYSDVNKTHLVYATERATGLKVSTQLPGGFASASFTLPVGGWEASRLFRVILNTHVEIYDRFGRMVYEGRVEDRTLTAEGLGLTANGYYSAANDVTMWTTFPATGNYTVRDLVVTAVDALSPTYWAEDFSFIGPNATSIGPYDLEFIGESKVIEVIEKALAFGAGTVELTPAHFALWEGRKAHYYPEVKASTGWYDWAVTADMVQSNYSLGSSLNGVYNKIQGVFDHPDYGQTWLGWKEDLSSQKLFGVREGTINIGSTYDEIATLMQDLALQTVAYPEQSTKFDITGYGKTHWGNRDNLYMVRAGQLLRVDDFDEAGIQLMTGSNGKDMAVGFINRTDYDADSMTLSVELGHTNKSLDLLISRLGLSGSGSVS